MSMERCLGNGFACIKSAIVLTREKLLVLALIIIESMAKLFPVLVVLVLSAYWIEQTLHSKNIHHVHAITMKGTAANLKSGCKMGIRNDTITYLTIRITSSIAPLHHT